MDDVYIPIKLISEKQPLIVSLIAPASSIALSAVAIVVSWFTASRTTMISRQSLHNTRIAASREFVLRKLTFIQNAIEAIAAEAWLADEISRQKPDEENLDRTTAMVKNISSLLLFLDQGNLMQKNLSDHLQAYWTQEDKIEWQSQLIDKARVVIEEMYRQVVESLNFAT